MTRVLVAGDAGVNTGFERVVRGISDHLFASGWDVRVHGISYTAESTERRYPYPVFPISTDPVRDPMGIDDIAGCVTEERPDVVLLIQDVWNIGGWLRGIPAELPVVGYFPVDGPNLKGVTCAPVAGRLSEGVTYTNFGAIEAAAGVRHGTDELFRLAATRTPAALTAPVVTMRNGRGDFLRMDRLARYQNPLGWRVIPHGLDRGCFGARDQGAARRAFGIPTTAFVVLNVGTNQIRKRLDLTLRVFAAFQRQRPDAFLVVHCQGGDREGWDLVQLADYLRIPTDRIRFIHQTSPNLTDESLCQLYNTADVQINTGGGEGWGLTAFEGALCGVPQVVPDWSATRELWGRTGGLIPIADVRVEPGFQNQHHAVIDVPAAARLLTTIYDSQEIRTTYREHAVAIATTQPTWADVGARFETVLTQALSEPRATAMPYSELVAERTPGVVSECDGRVESW